MNIEAEKIISTFVAKSLSGLPYEKSSIIRTDKKYTSTNSKKGFYLDTEFEVGHELKNKTELDKWLTERYCLYMNIGSKLYRYDIHHKEWIIRKATTKRLNLSYQVGNMNLAENHPGLVHYSDGVQVIAWRRKKL